MNLQDDRAFGGRHESSSFNLYANRDRGMRLPGLFPRRTVARLAKVAKTPEGGGQGHGEFAKQRESDSALFERQNWHTRSWPRTRPLTAEGSMQDLLWIVVTVAFFAISIGYVEFCDRIK